MTSGAPTTGGPLTSAAPRPAEPAIASDDQTTPVAAEPSRFPAVLGLAVLALLPLVVAPARGIRRGWVPVADNGLIATRAGDVLGDHHPLLGLYASASGSLGRELNHPGPLLFDALALPAELFPGGSGIAAGTAVLNGLSILGIAVVATRRAGAIAGASATLAAALLSWSLGSELLYEPFHNHAVLLPFLFFLLLVWSVSCGDLPALPWMVGVGSFVLQTTLSYAFLVPALAVWAIVGLVLARRRERSVEDAAEGVPPRRLCRRTAVVSLVVLGLCWSQPLVEQVSGDGPGNLGGLASNATEDIETLGAARGAKVVASVAALPPWWGRPSMTETVDGQVLANLPSTRSAGVGLVVLGSALVAAAWVAHRRGRREVVRAVVTAGVALGVGLFTAARAPVIDFFGVAQGHFRFLWPLSAFLTFVIGIAVLVPAVATAPARRRALVGLGVLTGVVVALNLPFNDQGSGTAPDWSEPVARDLSRSMGEFAEAPVFVELDGSDLRSAALRSYYGPAVIAELESRGVPFLVDGAVWERQFGRSRRFTGDNAQAVLSLRFGDDALSTPPQARRVALHEGLGPRERRARYDLASDLTAAARREWRGGSGCGGRPAAGASLASGELRGLEAGGCALGGDAWAEGLDRYARLDERWFNETVALVLRPIEGSA